MLWPFAINWVNAPVLRLEWLTEVQQSLDDSEFVTELRDGARRSLRFETLVGETDAERVLYENILAARQGETIQLPWWIHQVWIEQALTIGDDVISVTATTGREINAGDDVVLIHELRSEIVTVDSITADEITLTEPLIAAWPIGTKIVRVFDARIKPQLQLRYLNDRVLTTEVEFSAVDEWIPSVTETADYLGYSVLLTLTDSSDDMVAEYSRNIAEFDNTTGKRNWFDISGYGRRTRPHKFTCEGIQEVTGFFDWLAARRGRANPFWLPTHQQDFTLTANFSSSGTQLSVANAKHAIAFGQPGHNHLFIRLTDGTIFYRRMTAIVEINSTTERVTINSALGRNVTTADIDIMCYLQLKRLSSDAVEVRFETDACVTSVIGLTAKRDDQ